MIKKRKSFALIVSVLMVLSIVLSACSGGDESKKVAGVTDDGTKISADGKVQLDFWTFWGSETRRPIIEKIINDFNASQDKIYVKHTFLPWGDIWTKNLAAIAAGNPPDVIINDINTVKQRAENDQVTDLTPYLNKDEMQNKFYPELWDTVLHEDKVYALPFNTDTRLLYYNKKAFKDAGLDPNKPPATWEELEEYAKKLDKKQGNYYQQVGFYPLWGDFGANNWMLNADNGQAFFDENGNPTINTPAKLEALQWINSWTDRLGPETVNAMKAEFGSKQADPFISGKVAMWMNTGTYYTQIRDYGKNLEFGVAPIPEKEQGSGHWSWGGGFVAEVPKGSDNPAEAAEFVKYLTDVEAQSYWAIKNYDNVANIEASENVSSEMSDKDKMVYEASVKNLEVTKMTPIPLHAPDFINLINPEVDAVTLEKADPSKALDKAQKAVEKLIQSNK